MIKVLNLGDKEVEVRASALTPILYTAFFNKDYYKEYNASINERADAFLGEVCFIMNIQATEEHPMERIKAAKEDEFWEWCDKYPPMIFVDKMDDILAVMFNVEKTNTTAKKKQSKPTGSKQ